MNRTKTEVCTSTHRTIHQTVISQTCSLATPTSSHVQEQLTVLTVFTASRGIP